MTLEQVNQMTLEDLSRETIQFGQAKKGLSFLEAFKDHSWADWFISHYEKSDKPQHRKFIRFVELTLDAEVTTENLNRMKKTSGYPKTEKPKKSQAESSDSVWEQVRPPRDAYARHFLSVATFELCQAICSRFLVCSTFLVCSRFLESARICSRENP